ncbi:S41 family peptidase [Enterococcus sp. BWR-S5]|uniref:S41 family peptidase n=1 Tax=Enterococcus sp. BWR-S5 TaxID=2787714 RepID=UPI0019239C96|nr:S41 family peptidase [Enterococcus sp. BWR-S5]MBL1224641.1 S41 family peptidase [Enterococcus sp. BWR-S5]
MKKQHRVPYYQYIISIICTAVIVGGGSYTYFNYKYNSYISSQTHEVSELKEVHELYDDILTSYVGKVDRSELVEGALKGMMDSLDDPHSAYLKEEESSELNDEVSGSFEGIGATLGKKDKQLKVMEAPIEGSPAEKGGLKVNDTILKIDDQPVEEETLTESVKRIRGKKGSKVQLKIDREGETFDVVLTRDTIPLTTVSASLDTNPKIGNIRISSFGGKTFDELKTAVKELREEGAESFVIDLRQNPGGLLDQVEKMASMFLKDGDVIVQFEDKDKNMLEHTASSKLDGGFKVTEPVVVLVDGGSASASEIFAAALKESANIDIVGTQTYGKGTVQTVKNIGEKTSMKLSILKWLTPDGNWIHEEGLAPTIQADYPEYAYLSPISRSHVLQNGEDSEVITNLNKMLKALDFNVDETSIFDSKTQLAIEALQSDQGLPITGQVDDQTAAKIEGLLRIKIQETDPAYNKAIDLLSK